LRAALIVAGLALVWLALRQLRRPLIERDRKQPLDYVADPSRFRDPGRWAKYERAER
jgi:hypothetical protein